MAFVLSGPKAQDVELGSTFDTLILLGMAQAMRGKECTDVGDLRRIADTVLIGAQVAGMTDEPISEALWHKLAVMYVCEAPLPDEITPPDGSSEASSGSTWLWVTLGLAGAAGAAWYYLKGKK